MSNWSHTFSSRRCRWLTELVLYVSLAVGSTWPLATHVTTHLPLAHAPSSVATVPLLNVWTLWWNVRSLEGGYRTYWHAPIYCPERWYFAASEPQTLTGLGAWPLWHVLPNSVAVYNVLLLFFLTLNGWFAHRLLQRLQVRWSLALCGGAAMVVLPLVHWQLGVFQLASLWGILWVLYAAIGFRRRPTTRRAVYLAMAFAATYSLCCYYGLFLSLLLLLTPLVLFGRRLVQWRFWTRSLVAAAVAAVLLLPVVSAQLAFTREHNISYDEPWVRALSAVPRNYLVQPWARLPLLTGLSGPAEGPAWPLSPGILKFALAAIGLVLGVWARRTRRIAWGLLAIAAVAACASLGPRLSWHAFTPYQWLTDYYPGFAHVRSFYRFAFFVQIAVVLLATLGLQRLYTLCVTCRPRWHRVVLTATLLGGGLLVLETWPDQPLRYAVPQVSTETPWIAWLRDGERRDARLLFIPLPEDRSARAMQSTAEWMYCQTFHARPMANGYSTLTPRSMIQLSEKVRSLDPAIVYSALAAHGITHVVFDKSRGAVVDPQQLSDMGLHHVFTDQQAAIEIWSVF